LLCFIGTGPFARYGGLILGRGGTDRPAPFSGPFLAPTGGGHVVLRAHLRAVQLAVDGGVEGGGRFFRWAIPRDGENRAQTTFGGGETSPGGGGDADRVRCAGWGPWHKAAEEWRDVRRGRERRHSHPGNVTLRTFDHFLRGPPTGAGRYFPRECGYRGELLTDQDEQTSPRKHRGIELFYPTRVKAQTAWPPGFSEHGPKRPNPFAAQGGGVPGSHRRDLPPSHATSRDGVVVATLPAGAGWISWPLKNSGNQGRGGRPSRMSRREVRGGGRRGGGGAATRGGLRPFRFPGRRWPARRMNTCGPWAVGGPFFGLRYGPDFSAMMGGGGVKTK